MSRGHLAPEEETNTILWVVVIGMIGYYFIRYVVPFVLFIVLMVGIMSYVHKHEKPQGPENPRAKISETLAAKS